LTAAFSGIRALGVYIVQLSIVGISLLGQRLTSGICSMVRTNILTRGKSILRSASTNAPSLNPTSTYTCSPAAGQQNQSCDQGSYRRQTLVGSPTVSSRKDSSTSAHPGLPTSILQQVLAESSSPGNSPTTQPSLSRTPPMCQGCKPSQTLSGCDCLRESGTCLRDKYLENFLNAYMDATRFQSPQNGRNFYLLTGDIASLFRSDGMPLILMELFTDTGSGTAASQGRATRGSA